jgi:hypothetical protein
MEDLRLARASVAAMYRKRPFSALPKAWAKFCLSSADSCSKSRAEIKDPKHASVGGFRGAAYPRSKAGGAYCVEDGFSEVRNDKQRASKRKIARLGDAPSACGCYYLDNHSAAGAGKE